MLESTILLNVQELSIIMPKYLEKDYTWLMNLPHKMLVSRLETIRVTYNQPAKESVLDIYKSLDRGGRYLKGEDQVYIIVRGVEGSPMYVVCSDGARRVKRAIHKNHLLPCHRLARPGE